MVVESTAVETAAQPAVGRWSQLVVGVVCMVMIANLQYGWTLFVNPIDQKYQWGTAAIQLAFSIFIAVETWLVPIEGWFVDKYGPRIVVLVGGIFCAIGWAMCLGLGFERLVTIDILLYGTSLSLEFIALIVLRVREPELHRPFRVPGGMFGAVAVGIAPMLLLGFSVVRSETEQVLGMSSFAFGMMLIAAGVLAYFLNHALKPEGWAPAPQEKPEAVA